jgi:membrane protein DedA with SNARE-associated domain
VPASFIHWVHAYGAAALFVLLFLGVFGLPVPDETLLTFTGVLIREGDLHFGTAYAAAVLGSMGGISLSYSIGRVFGLGVVDRFGRWFHVTRADLARVEGWFERSGRWVLTFGYSIPGVRHFTAIVAGSSRLPAAVFARFAYAGAALWALTFIALGWYVGPAWEAALAKAQRHIVVVVIVAAALAIGYALLHRRLARRADGGDHEGHQGHEDHEN